MGHQPSFPGDRTAQQASALSNPYKLPKSLHQRIMIQIFLGNVHSAMATVDRQGDLISGPKRGLFLSSFESELQDLEHRLQTSSCKCYVSDL